jgi:tetratricopeptide (TPR) repeat protein
MKASNRNILQLLGLYLGIVAGLVILAILYGCLPSNTKWEEDRSIPFSPDDRAIAYRHKGSVYVARTQGDKHRRVFDSASDAIVSTPHWAPGQRAVIFAFSDGNKDPDTGLLTYEIWYWPAPEDIWTSESDDAQGDSVELPVRWTPASPQMIVSAKCRDEMQIRADALFSWHPDGSRVLFLDTAADGLQTVLTVDLNTSQRAIAAPIRATSLAFSIGPQGDQLQVAAADAEPTTLWIGPIAADRGSWRKIESSPGPRLVPQLEVFADGTDDEPSWLYDLRPRLGAWSPDSQWLAHTRVSAAEPQAEADDEAADRFELVMTPIAGDTSERVLELSGSEVHGLHWRPGGNTLALLSNTRLLLVDPGTTEVSEFSGVLEVERFIGWSRPGHHMAYLIRAEEFDETRTLLPTGDAVIWAPAERHNLMVAESDGTLPKSQFSLMNISAARWGNETEKLSFWATYEPTVSLLPRGDPAAVLDLDANSIRWYPTDIAEYANVGHYYLLNEDFSAAAKHYSDALRKISDDDLVENQSLRLNIRLWRGVARLASGSDLMAAGDLQYVRDNVTADFEAAPEWGKSVLPKLLADREILSTMLSMGQVQLAIDEANRIIAEDPDARRIQALCYLGLIYSSIGQPLMYSDRVVLRLIPETLESDQVPRQLADDLIDHYLAAVTRPAHQSQLSVADKVRLAGSLAELAASVRVTHPDRSAELSRSAIAFYREAGATEAELELLRAIADS